MNGIALETLGPLVLKYLLSLVNWVGASPSPLKITAKQLSYSNAYPLLCSDSMPSTFVTAFQFKSTLTKLFLLGLFYFCCSSFLNNNSIIIITMKIVCIFDNQVFVCLLFHLIYYLQSLYNICCNVMLMYNNNN